MCKYKSILYISKFEPTFHSCFLYNCRCYTSFVYFQVIAFTFGISLTILPSIFIEEIMQLWHYKKHSFLCNFQYVSPKDFGHVEVKNGQGRN